MDKKTFVETVLNDMVVAANDYYVKLSYRTKGAEEYVDVKCRDGHTISVCVTYDTRMGIVRDVSKNLL